MRLRREHIENMNEEAWDRVDANWSRFSQAQKIQLMGLRAIDMMVTGVTSGAYGAVEAGASAGHQMGGWLFKDIDEAIPKLAAPVP